MNVPNHLSLPTASEILSGSEKMSREILSAQNNSSAHTDFAIYAQDLQRASYWKVCDDPIRMLIAVVESRTKVKHPSLQDLRSLFVRKLKRVRVAYQDVKTVMANPLAQAPNENQISKYEDAEADFFQQVRFDEEFFFDFDGDHGPLSCRARRVLRFFWVLIQQTRTFVRTFDILFWGPNGGEGTTADREQRSAKDNGSFKKAGAYLSQVLTEFINAKNNSTTDLPDALVEFRRDHRSASSKKTQPHVHRGVVKTKETRQTRDEPGFGPSSSPRSPPVTLRASTSPTTSILLSKDISSPPTSPLVSTQRSASQVSHDLSGTVGSAACPQDSSANIILPPATTLDDVSQVSQDSQVFTSKTPAISSKRRRSIVDDGDDGGDDDEDFGDVLANFLDLKRRTSHHDQ